MCLLPLMCIGNLPTRSQAMHHQPQEKPLLCCFLFRDRSLSMNDFLLLLVWNTSKTHVFDSCYLRDLRGRKKEIVLSLLMQSGVLSHHKNFVLAIAIILIVYFFWCNFIKFQISFFYVWQLVIGLLVLDIFIRVNIEEILSGFFFRLRVLQNAGVLLLRFATASMEFM